MFTALPSSPTRSFHKSSPKPFTARAWEEGRVDAISSAQAVDYYLKALRSLGTRDRHPAVWDSVNWELSTTYFTMATLQQDYAPLSRKAQEQVRAAGLGRSLPPCEPLTGAERLPWEQRFMFFTFSYKVRGLSFLSAPPTPLKLD